MVMKHMYGEDQIRKFLKYELDRYLRARGGEPVEEQPLYRVENQGYIHYRKGSLVMYRLQREMGEDTVNRALRRLLAEVRLQGRALSDLAGSGRRAARRGAGRQTGPDHRPVREDHPLRPEDQGDDGEEARRRPL
jgi:aminopeptidase N